MSESDALTIDEARGLFRALKDAEKAQHDKERALEREIRRLGSWLRAYAAASRLPEALAVAENIIRTDSVWPAGATKENP